MKHFKTKNQIKAKNQRNDRDGWIGHMRSMAKDNGGAVIVLAAIGMPIAIGGMGLGAEVGYWYYTQRLLQHAADTAAHGTGVRRAQGDSDNTLYTVAHKLATEGGLPAGGTLAVNSPPSSGTYAGNNRAVEVVVTETLPRLFSGIFSRDPVNVTARAVSLYSTPRSACVLALAPNASAALESTGAGDVVLDCHSASNSMASDAFNMQGSTKYETQCVHTVGYAQPNNGLTLTVCSDVNELVPLTQDPYASVTGPTPEGPCLGKNVGNPQSVVTLTPTYAHSSGYKSMRFCAGLTFKGTVNLDPGIYIVEGGDFAVNAQSVITGTDVMFYFTNGAQSRMNGGAEMHLKGLTSGVYSGLLFFGDRTSTTLDHHVNGGLNSTFDGAVYFPSQKVTFNGNSSSNGGCTQIIGYTVTFNGDSAVGLDCAGSGVKPIDVAGSVQIVE